MNDALRQRLETGVLPQLRMLAKQESTAKHYRIAGMQATVFYHDAVFASRCMPALAPREADMGTGSGMTVHVVAGPLAGGAMEPFSRSGTVADAEGGARAVFFPAEGTLSAREPDGRTAYLWTENPAALPPFFDSAPMRTLLHWFINGQDMFLAHGAGLAAGGKAVLLTAKGGSGKSTTALAWLMAGLECLGDDYIAVRPGAAPEAFGVYGSLKATEETLRRRPFDAIIPDIAVPGEKSVIFTHARFPGKSIGAAPVKALLVPSITGSPKTSFQPISGHRALLALAPTAVLQLPMDSRRAFSRMRELVEAVPCYAMEMGPDSMEVVAAIRNFLV